MSARLRRPTVAHTLCQLVRSVLVRSVVLACCALGPAACGGDPPPPTAQRNVLLITVDTLRADFLPSYGFVASQNAPNTTALGRRGVVFEHAIATSSATVPAHASIMTSLYAREHSVGPYNGETRLEGVATLASHLRDAGYDTAAFIGNVVLKRRSGLDHGFDVYDDDLPAAEANRMNHFERIAEQTAERALAWLEARATSERPFFLWLHMQDPHGPYTPPASFALELDPDALALPTDRVLSRLSKNRGRAGIPAYQYIEGVTRPSEYASRYAGEIAYADHWIGRVIDVVEDASAERGVAVLLTADHGESFGEGGFFFQHGQATSPELARVPLIIVSPDLPPGRRAEIVSHVDIAPTLLELAGQSPLSGASGHSLVSLAQGTGSLPERVVYCDTPNETSGYFGGSSQPGEHYVRIKGLEHLDGTPPAPDGPPFWYAYERDAVGETWRSTSVDPEERAAVLRYATRELQLAPAEAMSEADVERLRALGYLPPAE